MLIYSNFLLGYYCSGSSEEPAPVGQPYGDICAVGSYCPNATDLSRPCPPGTYQPAGGMQALDDCLPCTAGSFCEYWGRTNVTGDCAPGYYCTLAANSSTPTDGYTGKAQNISNNKLKFIILLGTFKSTTLLENLHF